MSISVHVYGVICLVVQYKLIFMAFNSKLAFGNEYLYTLVDNVN
jgi:hypothetical protein